MFKRQPYRRASVARWVSAALVASPIGALIATLPVLVTILATGAALQLLPFAVLVLGFGAFAYFVLIVLLGLPLLALLNLARQLSLGSTILVGAVSAGSIWHLLLPLFSQGRALPLSQTPQLWLLAGFGALSGVVAALVLWRSLFGFHARAPSARYSAFISYSHADEHFAIWLQKKLESYVIPESLIIDRSGALTRSSQLDPVFRDRDELTAGGDLTAKVEDALAASDALVVICSPFAVASTYVDREIEAYRKAAPGGLIIPVLLAGEPSEAFPPAMRAHGELVAADFRKGRDGRGRGLVKVMAALLKCGLDDLVQRERRVKDRRLWVLAAAGTAVSAVVIVAALLIVGATTNLAAQTEEEPPPLDISMPLSAPAAPSSFEEELSMAVETPLESPEAQSNSKPQRPLPR